ncbi:cytochrome P450 [Streptomyces sp. NPDC048417]|uniref:cytochrome P450 n=1 Tax=Streptomyces sp. NPDC048417 TaxID=3155387 RepID=UPI00342C1644
MTESVTHPAQVGDIGRSPVWEVSRAPDDLADPHFYTDGRHLEIWRAARRVHPVAWTESGQGGVWSVTTHGEGLRVLKQPAVFRSGLGMRLGSDPAAVRAASDRMLVVSDGERHRALRSAHSSWFTPRAVAALRPMLQRRLDAALRELLARGTPFDAVAELAVRIPTWVLFDMMGVAGEDWEELARMTDRAFDDSDGDPAARAARTEAHTEIFGYFADLLDQRRECPGQDIVTSLIQARPGGRPLSDEDVILNCDGLMNGGLETTPHAVSGALLALAQHPRAWERLKERPDLVDSAAEEILRWTSPPTHAMRIATEDTDLGPARIRRGDRVVIWFPSCNRDESVFDDPDTFLIDRSPNPHISFGAGPHHCIGSALARLEVRCVLEALLRRVRTIEVAGEPVRRASNFLHGLAHLEVRLTPEDRA